MWELVKRLKKYWPWNHQDKAHKPLDLENPPDNTRETGTQQILLAFTQLLLTKDNLPRLSMAAALTVLSTAMNFLAPYSLAKTIEALSKSEQESFEIAGITLSKEALVVWMIACASLAQVLPSLRDQTLVPVQANNIRELIKTSCAHLLKKSWEYHTKNDFSTQLVLIQKSFGVSNNVLPFLSKIIPTCVEIGVACTILTTLYGISIGINLLILACMYTAYSAKTTPPIIDTRQEMLEANNDVWKKFTQALKGYKAMRDFCQYDFNMSNLETSLAEIAAVNVKVNTLPIYIGLGHITMVRLSMLVACFYVTQKVRQQTFTVNDFILVTGYFNQLSLLLPGFGAAINQLFASWPDLKFVFSELIIPDEVVDNNPDVPLSLSPEEAPSITFDNVRFCFSQEKPVFNGLSFHIKPGQRVALVGESGEGKSTIFNLLYGYYQPTGGKILINDQDRQHVSLTAVQRSMTLFGQNPNLSKGSVRENICFGARDPRQVKDEEIWKIAKQAKLESFLLQLPKQLDTDVGDDGRVLSGGGQQKVAILRALMKKGPILLMDEITASLDSQSAKSVMNTLRENLTNVTTLVITHKLTEIKDMDCIIVIAKGRVVAQGTHETLMSTCSLYQDLWKGYQTEHETVSQEVISSGPPTPTV